MMHLLLGPDDFSKKEYINTLAEKHKSRPEFYAIIEDAPDINQLISQDLFLGTKIFVLENLIEKFHQPRDTERLTTSGNQIIFIESKLDKRQAANKQLLSSPKIETRQFDLPHGSKLNSWISARVKVLGGIIEPLAVEELAVRLGRDESKETKIAGKIVDVKEVFNLWQAEGEIKKLLAYARGRKVEIADVLALVPENSEVDILSITNAIADNQKTLVFALLQKFLLEANTADEKDAVIHLNALLSEQFRNVAMIQNFLANKTPEDEILEQTGWKPGRLFITKKIAGRFDAKKVLDFLNRLSALDEELKTASTPPRVLLDLIVSQLL